ncbi:MAG: DUF3316 domain-containing protein [Prevotella sp.]|nr:DUF3316 domain-containing protein [Prevotella sp.]
MKKHKYLLFATLIWTLTPSSPLPASAQEQETRWGESLSIAQKEKATMFAIGSANVLDTYLSAEKYHGTEFRIVTNTRKPLSKRQLIQSIAHQGAFTTVENRAKNSNELGAMYHFSYALRRHWAPSSPWLIEAGGGIDAHLGMLYNTRNSNNPVQAYAAIHLSPSVAVSYRQRLWHRNITLRYVAKAPLVGIMFSPNYGQSYYEIFSRGNYDHNIVPTTIVSTPSLCHAATIDIQLKKSNPRSFLRLGYLGDYQQSNINHLKRHHYSHLFLIGWAKTLSSP